MKILKFSDVSGTDSIPETVENFNILTWLLARKYVIEFCRRGSIKTYEYICWGCSSCECLPKHDLIENLCV